MTGSLNTNELTATVATRPSALRDACTPPAMSTCAMIQPPKIAPLMLRSEGAGMRRSVGSRSGGCGRGVALVSGEGSEVMVGVRSARASRRDFPFLLAQLAAQDLADVAL